MNALTKKLNLFLSACGGNWRNCLCVSDRSARYLVAMDWDAKPVVMDMEEFRRMTGVPVDPAECCTVLSGTRFRDLYARYLFWEISDPAADPLIGLCRRQE